MAHKEHRKIVAEVPRASCELLEPKLIYQIVMMNLELRARVGVINPDTNVAWTKAEAHSRMTDMLGTPFFRPGVVAEQQTAELNGTAYVVWQVARSAKLDADYAAWKNL